MIKKNFKGRCEKRYSDKGRGVLKVYNDIQAKYILLLENNTEIKKIQCNVLLDEKFNDNEYTTDFNADFPYLNPVISKNSENSFTINFAAQDKQVTYDFDKLYKLINFKDYNLEYLEYKNLEKEIGLHEFVSSIEDKLYTEWDKAIDNCHFSESLNDVVEHELG